MFTAIMAVCEATAATSVQRRAQMQSRSREWWGRVVLQRNSFHQNVQGWQRLRWRMLIWSGVGVTVNPHHMSVQTEVTFQQIKSASDLEPCMKVAQIWFEKIRFCVICVVHTVFKKKKPNQIWVIREESGWVHCVNTASVVWAKPSVPVCAVAKGGTKGVVCAANIKLIQTNLRV